MRDGKQMRLTESGDVVADDEPEFVTDPMLAAIVEDAEGDLRAAAGKLARVRRHLSGAEDIAA
ncbi:MAG: hypothetical protein ACYCQK_01785 [Acidiferrobacteraceae bacterium]